MNGQYEIGRFFSEGWQIFRQNMQAMVVAFILYIGVMMAANMVPFFGGLVGFAITGPMLGGLMRVALRAADNEAPSWNGIFDGFQKFLPLFLANLMISVFSFVPVMAIMIPAILVLGLGGMMAGDPGGEVAENALAAMGGGILLAVLVAIFAYLVIYSWYLYTYLFIMETDDDFWPAMEKSRRLWFANPVPTTLFVIVLSIVSVSGVIVFGVGILLTAPFGFCVMAVAYRNVAHTPLAPPSALGSITPVRPSAPPPPPPPVDYDRFADIPARSGETLEVPSPVANLGSPFRHCYVFVEKTEVSAATAEQIVKLGAPKAAGHLPPGGITPLQIDEWPADDHALSETIRENIRARNGEYLDGHRFHISVWKGRDKKSGKNMAVATVTTA